MTVSILLGNAIQLKAKLMDSNDVALPQTNVRLLIVAPSSGTSSIVSSGVASDGWVTAEYTPNEVGTYYWRFENTGSPSAAEEGSFTVEARTVPAP